MEKVKLDKVGLALAEMNDAYWNCVVSNMSALENQAGQIVGAFIDAYRVLLEAQVEVLEARYSGYQQLVSMDEAVLPEMVSRFKKHLEKLESNKSHAANELTSLLEGLQASIVLAQTLGEPSPPQKGGGDN